MCRRLPARRCRLVDEAAHCIHLFADRAGDRVALVADCAGKFAEALALLGKQFAHDAGAFLRAARALVDGSSSSATSVLRRVVSANACASPSFIASKLAAQPADGGVSSLAGSAGSVMRTAVRARASATELHLLAAPDGIGDEPDENDGQQHAKPDQHDLVRCEPQPLPRRKEPQGKPPRAPRQNRLATAATAGMRFEGRRAISR